MTSVRHGSSRALPVRILPIRQAQGEIAHPEGCRFRGFGAALFGAKNDVLKKTSAKTAKTAETVDKRSGLVLGQRRRLEEGEEWVSGGTKGGWQISHRKFFAMSESSEIFRKCHASSSA